MSEARIWDQLAGRYDRIVRLFDASYPKVRKRLELDLRPGGRVLEVAAGTGQFTQELARVTGHVVATDVSPKMVAALRQAVERSKAANIETRVMSAYDIESADATFDAVFCANALHVMDEPARALAEFHRVLREEGTLIAPTFLHGVDRVRRGLSRTLSLVSPFVANSRFDLADLKALISEAGFDVVHADRMPGVFPLGYVVARRATTR